MSAKKALLAVLSAAVALAALALFIPFDGPGLGREVSERVRSATGVELQISLARLRLLSGLVLEDARAAVGSYDVRVARMTLEHRPLALLKGRFQVTGVRLDDTRIGSVSIEALGLAFSRLDYDSRALTPLHGLSIEGVLDIGKVAFEGRELRDLIARVTTANGRWKLQDLKLVSDHGELSGELGLDFNSLPFRYSASLFGPSFQVEGVGGGKLRLEAEGFGTKLRSLKGKGVFELERGKFPDAPWIREIDPALAGAGHGAVEIPFEVRDERVYLERFEIEATGRVLEIEGSVGLDGSRDLRATVNRRRD